LFGVELEANPFAPSALCSLWFFDGLLHQLWAWSLVPGASFGLELQAQPFAPLVLGSLKNTCLLIVVFPKKFCTSNSALDTASAPGAVFGMELQTPPFAP